MEAACRTAAGDVNPLQIAAAAAGAEAKPIAPSTPGIFRFLLVESTPDPVG